MHTTNMHTPVAEPCIVVTNKCTLGTDSYQHDTLICSGCLGKITSKVMTAGKVGGQVNQN